MEAKQIIRNLIRESISNLLENAPLADKIYFNTGKLSPRVKEIIERITGKDNYMKIVTDIYWNYLQQSIKNGKWALSVLDGSDYEEDDKEETSENDVLHIDTLREIKGLYEELKNYNKNVFPIEGFDLLHIEDVGNIIWALKQRKKILEEFKKLPSVAGRNMKADIRQERSGYEMNRYRDRLEYFLGHFSLLGNRNDELKQKIINKMFKTNITLEQLLDFVEEKRNLLGGAEFTKEKIREIAETEDVEIVYEQGNIMIVEVSSPNGIKAVGCNSLWCFTYGNDRIYDNWSTYSTNYRVYVIIDFAQPTDDSEFMYVLIRQLTDDNNRFIKYSEEDVDNGKTPLFNMSNENYYDPYSVLSQKLGVNYKKIIRKYLNFGY